MSIALDPDAKWGVDVIRDHAQQAVEKKREAFRKEYPDDMAGLHFLPKLLDG